MPELKFLANMNISPLTVIELQREGWDIIRVSEVMDSRTPDLVILEYARQNNRVIITQDLDFSALLALRGYSKPSVVNLRLEEPTPIAVTSCLLQVLPTVEKELGRGAIATIDEATVRIRNLPVQLD